ncbi:prolipoprotein diacylglyceryl transferase [Nocardia bovistercoris]|uniref:Mce-associated membrane protein n=1 Tax=Nocardia bovistercoris TaxID=2785916 RepID=A0A931IGP1_9NOCA|nr:hypothetical protein [Nocardia bovistercoris]MBH0781209.1 hypothetical protein [Nocardia bovistercoris]
MSTDDAGTAKDAENTEAGDVAANTGESIADEQAAPSLEKKEGSGESAQKDEAEATAVGAGKPDAVKSESTKSEDGKSEPAKSEAGKAEAERADGSRRAGLTPIVAAFVAGVLLVAAVTAVVVFYLQADKRGDELAAIEDSTHAACTFSRNVSSYDYSQNLDEFFTTVKAGSTGEFLKQFADAADTLKEVMVKSQVKSRAEDAQCGYQSGDTESAKVLVSLTLVRGNFTQAAPQPEYVSLIADMKNEGGTWKVSKLDSPILAGNGGGLPGGASVPSGQAPAPGN